MNILRRVLFFQKLIVIENSNSIWIAGTDWFFSHHLVRRLTIKLIKLISLLFLETVIIRYQRNWRLRLNNFSLKFIKKINFRLIIWLKIASFLLTNKDKIKWFFDEILSFLFLLIRKLWLFSISWWVDFWWDDWVIFLNLFLLCSFFLKFGEFEITQIDGGIVFGELEISFGERIRKVVHLWLLIERIMVHTVLILV